MPSSVPEFFVSIVSEDGNRKLPGKLPEKHHLNPRLLQSMHININERGKTFEAYLSLKTLISWYFWPGLGLPN